MPTLCLINDADGSMADRWEMVDQPLTVGRGDRANVKIDDETLARRHFMIVREGERYLIEDLHSQKGTWVNGRPILASKLQHTECIVAGRTLFLFKAQPAVARAVFKPLTGPRGTAGPVGSREPEHAGHNFESRP